MQGIDLLVGRERDRGQSARSVVRASVFRGCTPKALVCVFGNTAILYVLFVEDDCRMLLGIRLRHILTAARRARGRAAWLGYSLRQGVPKVGAHLLCFSRASLARFCAIAGEADTSGRLAFDTLLHAMWSRKHVWAPAVSLAFQEGHDLTGRQ